MMTNWIAACPLTQIEEEGVMRFDHAGRTFAVYRMTGEEVFCSDGLCTHEAVHLSEGMVMDYEIECPKHSGIFDIRTGEAKRLPACVNLKTYPARVADGVVQIMVG
jgi:MocE subfamily Rieske [2Fe-2S] domain protein